MSDYDPAIKDMMDNLLLAIPGVTGGKAFGYPAYRVAGRMFAFVGGPGIALKLPAARVQAMVALGGPYHAFQPVEGTVWREWLSIDHADPQAYHAELALMEESAAFVGGS